MHDASPFTVLWGLLLPSNILDRVMPFTYAQDWTFALWFAYLYWMAKYRMSQEKSSSKETHNSGPRWDRWDEEFDNS